MGMFNIGKKKKLLALQQLLFISLSDDELIFTEEELYGFANERARQYLNDIQKSVETANTTTRAKDYFSSYDNVIHTAELLVKLEPYVNFTESSPSQSLTNVMKQEQASIKAFLTRCCEKYCNSSKHYNSPEEKQNVYNDLYNEVSPYLYRMVNSNIRFLENECKNQILNTEYEAIEKVPAEADKEACVSKFEEAVQCIIDAGQASTSLLQRKLKIGYARASRMIDEMELIGIVAPNQGSKPRDVLITSKEWLECKSDYIDAYNILADVTSEDSLKPIVSEETILPNGRNPENDIKLLEGIGIEADYSNDGFFLNSLDSALIPKSDDNTQIFFIDNVIKYASSASALLVLISDNLIYDKYKKISHLLVPIITDIKKAEGALHWLYCEMTQRFKIFSMYDCKDINSYNKLIEENIEYMRDNPTVADEDDPDGESVQPVLEVNGLPVSKEKLPHLIIIIQEVYYLFKNSEIDDAITQLLLNSKASGISLIFFSKFAIKNLSLGVKEDLLKVYTKEDLARLFIQSDNATTSSYSIEYIENALDGYEFEQFCGNLLKCNGFTKIEVTKQSKDFGVDIIAFKDDIKYAIQCKKYSNPVGIAAVQEVIASKSMFDCHIAAVLTNSTFTNGAKELAAKNKVLLWDRDKLISMMKNK